MKKEKYNVAIVGATGAVGQEMMSILKERNFPLDELRLIASERSAGNTYNFDGKEIKVKKLDHNCFDGINIALFSAGSSRSNEFASSAVDAGCVVIDNSSAFRMNDDVRVTGYTHQQRFSINLVSAQVLVVNFDKAKNRFLVQ